MYMTRTQKDDTPRTITLIDGKRATNVAIAIARIKMTHEEMRTSIETLSDSSFTCQQLESLRECLPNSEEEAALKAYAGPIEVLGEVINLA